MDAALAYNRKRHGKAERRTFNNITHRRMAARHCNCDRQGVLIISIIGRRPAGEVGVNKLFAAVLVAAGIALSAGSVQALPIGHDRIPDTLLIPVADGCGINKYRDAKGVCRRKYYFRRKSPWQFYSACGGKHAYRECNFIGQCWMVCD